jgi:nucleotide-binding universal stress UspA family protein
MPELVIIGYDGSHDADLAVDFAAAKLSAQKARVVTVWEPGLAAADVTPVPGAARLPSPEEDARFEEAARQTADSGAARAVAAGLSAEPEIARGVGVGDIARALLDVAEQYDADLLVVGRRGMGRIRSAVLGSVSDAAVRDGRRPVLVVPGPTD